MIMVHISVNVHNFIELVRKVGVTLFCVCWNREEKECISSYAIYKLYDLSHFVVTMYLVYCNSITNLNNFAIIDSLSL